MGFGIASALSGSSTTPVFYVPERVMAVPHVSRDDAPARASSVLGFDTGISRARTADQAPAMALSPSADWAPPAVTAPKGNYGPFMSDRADSSSARGSDWLRFSANDSRQASPRSMVPMSWDSLLHTQAASQNEQEMATMGSNEAAVGHKISMSIIENYK